MRTLKRLVPPALLLAGISAAQACSSPPVDSTRTDRRLFQVKGVIQGTVTYTGLRPCSRNGHIIGSAIILVFDRRNPPPPVALANTAINFGVVPGDVLFANEPRNPGTDVYCPKDHGITDQILVGAPFTVAPMDEGPYIIQSFYDYTGDFLPTFKIRNLPEASDVLGGYVDTGDAAKHVGDVNYQPIFLPVNVGNPDPKSPSGFTIPDSGFVADNVSITIGTTTPLPRPYFYPVNTTAVADRAGPTITVTEGDSSDKPVMAAAPMGSQESCTPDNIVGCNYLPVITMTQDFHVKAQPTSKTQANINEQQASFVQFDLKAGVPDAEVQKATDPTLPFRFQAKPVAQGGGLFVWVDPVKKIPETTLIPQLWPLVVFAKLQDDRTFDMGGVLRKNDPQNLLAQGSHTDPVVIIQGITVFEDALFNTTQFGPDPIPTSPAKPVDHVHVLVRPSAVCFSSADNLTRSAAQGNISGAGGTLVTPFQRGFNPGSGPDSNNPEQNEAQIDIADLPSVILKQGGLIAGPPRIACLPKGRYAINVVYPTGQAWTVPNEAGNCATLEGTIQGDPTGGLQCSVKTRPVLYSQGTRAVLEIIAAADQANCQPNPQPGRPGPVPDECLPCAQRSNKGHDKNPDGTFKFPECN